MTGHRQRGLPAAALAAGIAAASAAVLAQTADRPGIQPGEGVLPGQNPTVPDTKVYDQGSYRGTPWVSGGVGVSAREELLQKFDDYNLKLEFAVQDGNYIGDVAVDISRAGGDTVMRAFSGGPWFMTKLPAGTYDIRVRGWDESFSQTVQVPAQGLETVVFSGWTKEGINQITPWPVY